MAQVAKEGVIHVIGGGTVNHVRSHFALGAMSYGETARTLHERLWLRGLNVRAHFTKIASAGKSKIESNAEMLALVQRLIKDPTAKGMIFNVDVADFEGKVGDIPSGKYAQRLESRAEELEPVILNPSPKIVALVKEARPDIFLVTFKTTTHGTRDIQIEKGKRQMAGSKADLVLANDTGTRNNILLSKEGHILHETHDRAEVMGALADAFCSYGRFNSANGLVRMGRALRLATSQGLMRMSKAVGPQ